MIPDIRTGKFAVIHETALKKLLALKESGEDAQTSAAAAASDNPEKALKELILFSHSILEKIFIFCIGIFPGLALLHIFLLTQGNTDGTGDLSNYANISLRINQVLLFVSIVTCVGSIYLYMVTRRQSTTESYIRSRK